MATEGTAKITSGLELTKDEVRRYYSRPDVQKKLLPHLQGRDLLVGQSPAPNQIIYKRYDKGSPIRINTPSELEWYGSRRHTEFHPTIGAKTNELWVDIDSGSSVGLNDAKFIVPAVEEALRKMPNVRDTNIAFSGGRGFYVRGQLDKYYPTDAVREKLKKVVKNLAHSRDDVVWDRPPATDEVRLDISTFHDKGSIRAPHALNSATGFISVPLTRNRLQGFDPVNDANPRKLAAEKEFAPGIPMNRTVHDLPELSGKTWTMAIQLHNAERAGKHWDLRLVDPDTTHAHSWAVPKAKLPSPLDPPILAVRTPTHTASYALNYGVKGPKEIKGGYGKGMVEMVHKEPVTVLSSKPDRIKFERKVNGLPQQFILFQTKGPSWMIKNVTKVEKEASMTPFEQGWQSALRKLGMGPGREDQSTSLDSPMPRDTADDHLPAGQLAAALSQLSSVPTTSEASKTKEENVEGHLNRNTVWSEPHPIANEMATGPSPIMPGRF